MSHPTPPMRSPWGKAGETVASSPKPQSLLAVMQDEIEEKSNAESERLARALQFDEYASAGIGQDIAGETIGPSSMPASEPERDSPSDADTLSDYELALLLQQQFNEERDSEIAEEEYRYNKQNGKISVSLDRFRMLHPQERAHLREDRRLLTGEESESDEDDCGDAPDELTYHKGTRTMRNASGDIITKHNAEASARRNGEKMTDHLPLSFPCGDLRKHRDQLDWRDSEYEGGKGKRGKGARVPNAVYNKLQTFAHKSEKQRHRSTEKKDHSTSEMALDTKTRLILFRMVNAKILDVVNGAVSAGKEAAVFHASRHVDPDDPESPEQEVAIKVFKTTLTEFKQRQQFLHGDRRFENRVGRQSARKLVKLWAEKESANLIRMHRAGLACPEVILQHKHVLLLSFIGTDGHAAPKLKEARLSPRAITNCLADVRAAMRTLHADCKLVHADLSEYNMLYYKKRVYIIDVGQAVQTSHPRANEYLYRDCVNVCRFFKNAGESSTPTPQTLFTEITGTVISDEEAVQFLETINSSRQAPKSKLANSEVYMMGLCHLSDARDPGPAFRDPFSAAGAAPAATVDMDKLSNAATAVADSDEESPSSDEEDMSSLRSIAHELKIAAEKSSNTNTVCETGGADPTPSNAIEEDGSDKAV